MVSKSGDTSLKYVLKPSLSLLAVCWRSLSDMPLTRLRVSSSAMSLLSSASSSQMFLCRLSIDERSIENVVSSRLFFPISLSILFFSHSCSFCSSILSFFSCSSIIALCLCSFLRFFMLTTTSTDSSTATSMVATDIIVRLRSLMLAKSYFIFSSMLSLRSCAMSYHVIIWKSCLFWLSKLSESLSFMLSCRHLDALS